MFERLRSFSAGVVLAAQSVEGLHDDEGERARLLNSASTLDRPSRGRPRTDRHPRRHHPEGGAVHQLDVGGPTGLGSLRLQDTYRIDPNDLRSLATGVAWVVTGGRAAKVAVAAARGTSGAGSALLRGGTPPSSPPPDSDRQAQDSIEDDDPVVSDRGEVEPVAGSGQKVGGGEVSPPLGSNRATKSASPYAQGL